MLLCGVWPELVEHIFHVSFCQTPLEHNQKPAPHLRKTRVCEIMMDGLAVNEDAREIIDRMGLLQRGFCLVVQHERNAKVFSKKVKSAADVLDVCASMLGRMLH